MKSRALIQGKFEDRLRSARTQPGQLSNAPAARRTSPAPDHPASEQQPQKPFSSSGYQPQPLRSRTA
jgi:hypothetical protein